MSLAVERRSAGNWPFVGWCIAGLVAAAAMSHALGSTLAEADRLRGSVAALPYAAWAFAVLSVLAVRRGARRLPPVWWGSLALVSALWAAFALARPHLGVVGLEPALAAIFVGIAFVQAAGQVLALRPLLGRQLPARPSWLFAAVPLVLYLAAMPYATNERPPDGDEPWYLLITHSLAHDFDVDLTNNYANGDWRGFLARPMQPQPGDPTGPHGELYSRHNALLPLLLAPAYWLAGVDGTMVVMALLTAAFAWMTLRIARHYVADLPGEALIGYALVALGPPLLLYASQIWVEVPAGLLVLLGLDGLLSGRALDRVRDRRRWLGMWLLVGIVVVLLPMLKIRFMLLAAPLLALAWWRTGRPWRPALVLGAVLVVLGGGILLYNQIRFDNPLKIHSWQEVELVHYGWKPYARGALGLFFDAGFGLFACAPIWALLIPAGFLLLRRKSPLLLDLGAIVLPYLAVVLPRNEWYGGWSPPFRYALVAMPLLGVALAPLLASRRTAGARALLAGLGALSLGLGLLWIAVPGWTYNFADGRTYLLDFLSTRVGADVARFFPSSIRPRFATYAWPLAAAVVLPLLWRWPRGRSRAAAGFGVAAVIVALAVLPAAARSVPTRTLELEDPQVIKHGGHQHPDRWVFDRTRFRGAWVLRELEWLEAPVVPGGERAHLVLEGLLVRHHPGPLMVEIAAGERSLTTLRLTTPRRWERHDLGTHEWPAGAPLVIRLVGSQSGGDPNGMLLDRVRIDWQ